MNAKDKILNRTADFHSRRKKVYRRPENDREK